MVHGQPLFALVEGERLQGHSVEVKLSQNGLPDACYERAGGVTIILGRGREREGGGGRGREREGGGGREVISS